MEIIIEGNEEIVLKLQTLAELFPEEVVNILENVAADVAIFMQEAAPQGATGSLKESISYEVQDNTAYIGPLGEANYLTATPPGEYGYYVEKGKSPPVGVFPRISDIAMRWGMDEGKVAGIMKFLQQNVNPKIFDNKEVPFVSDSFDYANGLFQETVDVMIATLMG